jgi:Phage protein (N4 Gp49/phage Sf6 gene 66) family
MPTDQQLEGEIQAKGLTAPRVTPQQIEGVIAHERYFTADKGVLGVASISGDTRAVPDAVPEPLSLLTICVLVLRNGFTVLGKSACASPENFDAELGRKIARQDAVNQIWPLEGYLLREKLYQATTGA